jgi:hypothetical protein
MFAFLDRLFGCSRESVKNKKRRDGLEPTEVEEVLIDSIMLHCLCSVMLM